MTKSQVTKIISKAVTQTAYKEPVKVPTNYIEVKVHRDMITGESKNSIVLNLGDKEVWIAKKNARPSTFTNIVKISIGETYTYTLTDGTALSGVELINVLNNLGE